MVAPRRLRGGGMYLSPLLPLAAATAAASIAVASAASAASASAPAPAPPAPLSFVRPFVPATLASSSSSFDGSTGRGRRLLPSPPPPPSSTTTARSALWGPHDVGAGGAAAASSGGRKSGVLVGRITPFFSKLFVTPKKARAIAAALRSAAHPLEVLAVAALGWGSVPAARWWFRALGGGGSDEFDVPDGGADAEDDDGTEEGRFEGTRLYHVAKVMGQIFKIACAVYAVDCLEVSLGVLGFEAADREDWSQLFAKGAYGVWLTLRLRDFKHTLLQRVFASRPKVAGKLPVYDRLLNAVLYTCAAVALSELLKVRWGMTLSGLLSVGGVGTLVFSLASKDLAEQLVGGLALSTSDRFYEGDWVELGDGTSGTVTKIGWTHTEFRGGDEVVVSMPNSQIFKQRVKNVSRVRRCQVRQTLWFSYDDIDKMSAVCDAVKREIKLACPSLITAARPFRAHWREFGDDHLEVVVDCHFNLPPTGNQYWDNRQRVLEAIGRAADKCGVEFAFPTFVSIGKGGGGGGGGGGGSDSSAPAAVPPPPPPHPPQK